MEKEKPDVMRQRLIKCVSTPVVIVLGATGAGKSRLALELAQKFGGQIVGADAMQMYKGLDIVTNKVTKEERSLVPHHMIDFLDPMTKWTVVDYRNMALPIINELRSKNVMPIICGGTNYYIESLIWKILIENESKSTKTAISNKKLKVNDIEITSQKSSEEISSRVNVKVSESSCADADNDHDSSFKDNSNLEIYEILRKIDPERANELHVNERRKVIRSIEIYDKHKRPHSEILDDQKSETGGGVLGGPLRFDKNELAVLWVQCDQDTLDKRCDKRVLKMIEGGMIKELTDFHTAFNANRASKNQKPDYTNGIFQSIGFKEFHQYLTCNVDVKEEKKKDLYEKGIEQLQLVTRQYARKQVKWMRQRFLHANRSRPDVFMLDSTKYPENWNKDVYNPAVEIVQAYIDGTVAKYQPMECDAKLAYSHEDTRKIFPCDVCNIKLKGKIQYEIHRKSKRHSNMIKHLKKTSQLIDQYEKKLKSNHNLD